MGVQERTPAGRPRSFDEESVLAELTALFWRQGYGQTSMSDIVAASGVHKPSLYRAFGGKDELFTTVLRRYLRERMEMFTRLIAEAGPGVDGVHRFLDLVGVDAASERGRDGCLMVMSSNELRGTLGDYDFGADYRRQMHEVLGTLVRRTLPGAPDDDVVLRLRTDLLTTHLLGLHVVMRSGASSEEIGRCLAAMHHVVDTW
ncbi:TetR/AcrR family transcriptional regulator [Isoptericola chiayiensis]|uniref:TetR/AcrR family transcriptional regulator n=1 Tax=Isoptericola chiayiensis TaxID=579446 RepID=A0ABP8Y5Q8_9MICO|nr:TetR/AcrR family transcriptional regulator [Isoptericola chiayiensis]NOW00602.1 TetR/AcrR family transcriptional repressor of nem operon [Isoptericola chiayiensis]